MKRPGPAAFGAYRVLGTLGRGGEGVIYRARHGETGEAVALKTVRVPSQSLLASLRREIHTLSRLRHPGIVRIVEQGLQDGVPWYAMELIEGEDLASYCRRLWDPGHQHLSAQTLQQVLTPFRRLCRPLGFLHGEGIVHRDLKPGNVLVRAGGDPVLVDFGLRARFGGAGSRESLEVGGYFAGTYQTMAPEQILGELVDARADLYALGVMLYRLLGGRAPFERLQDVLSVPVRPAPLSSFVEGIPEELDALVLRLLSKWPSQRLGHADDVAAALARLGARNGWAGELPRPRSYLYRPRLAGRSAAIGVLEDAFSRLEAQAGGLLIVSGESGVGKTRLLLELAREAQERRMSVLAGECLPGQGIAAGSQGSSELLQPLKKPLLALADRCREGGETVTERLLGRRCKVLAAYEPTLAGLPGQERYPEPAELGLDAARHRLFLFLAESFRAFAGTAPLVLILDDLQWADELTLGYLRFVARTQSSGPVLVVGACRSEEAGDELNDLLTAPAVTALSLSRLKKGAVGQMVSDMLALASPPSVFVSFLARHSEGNPFFVAEVLRSAIEERLLWRDSAGRWQLGEPGQVGAEAQTPGSAVYEALPLPRSIRELVARRLEALPAAAAILKEAAAVLGREQSAVLLQRVAELQEQDFLQGTEELLRRQVLEEPSPGRLRFAHDKIREVAYGQIPVLRQSRLHGAAAERMEELFGVERGEHLVSLGDHWERAGRPENASRCYLAAARKAVAGYAHREAERLYRAYLRLAGRPTPESLAASRELITRVLFVQGRTQDALELGRQARTQAQAVSARAEEGKLLTDLALLEQTMGRHEAARELATLALERHRQLGERQFEGRTLVRLGEIERYHGRHQEACRLFEQSLGLLREEGDREAEAEAMAKLGASAWDQAELERGQTLYEEALAIYRETGNRLKEGLTLDNLASFAWGRGELEQARELCQKALSIHRQVGDRRDEGVTLGHLSMLSRDRGRLDEARELAEHSLVILREVGDRSFEAWTLSHLGWLHLKQGRLEQARPLLDAGLAIQRELGLRMEEPWSLLGLATVERLSGGNLERAERLAVEAETKAREVNNLRSVVSCLCERGTLLLARGEDAGSLLEEASRLVGTSQLASQSDLTEEVAALREAVQTQDAGRSGADPS